LDAGEVFALMKDQCTMRVCISIAKARLLLVLDVDEGRPQPQVRPQPLRNTGHESCDDLSSSLFKYVWSASFVFVENGRVQMNHLERRCIVVLTDHFKRYNWNLIFIMPLSPFLCRPSPVYHYVISG
jgi:hypothetical protein